MHTICLSRPSIITCRSNKGARTRSWQEGHSNIPAGEWVVDYEFKELFRRLYPSINANGVFLT